MEELAYQINKGRTSDFQNENFAYVVTMHKILTVQEEEQHKQKTLEVAQEANNIASKANIIAGQALVTSTNSYRMAIFAVVVSLIALVLGYFK